MLYTRSLHWKQEIFHLNASACDSPSKTPWSHGGALCLTSFWGMGVFCPFENCGKIEEMSMTWWLDDLMTRTCDFLMVSWNKSLVVWRHLLCTTGSIHGHMSNDLWCYCMERFAARTLQSLEMDRVFRRPRVGKTIAGITGVIKAQTHGFV